MSQPKEVELHYFEITGRAQPLRDLLYDAEVSFVDLREPREHGMDGTWRQRVEQEGVGGPHGTLPVLRWGEVIIPQTEAIAWFSAQALGYGGEDPVTSAQCMALCSAAHQDIVVPLGFLLWQGVLNPGGDLRPFAEQTRQRMLNLVAALERQLTRSDGPYFFGDKPTIGDFFVFEAARAIAEFFGSVHLEPFSSLKTMMIEMAARPGVVEADKTRPAHFSSCPIEDMVRHQLNTLD